MDKPALHRRRLFALAFAAVYGGVYLWLQAPFASPDRFIMEKDQMDLLYLALIGSPEGYSVGVTDVRTLPVLQYLYALFFVFSTSLVALFWALAALKLGAILGLWALLRRHLAPYLAELLALLFLFEAHRHWDYWAAFLPNTHAEPFVFLLLFFLLLFHLRGRFAHFHAANVVVCLLLNFHAVNGALLLLPAVVAWKSRARFDRRTLLLSTLPFALLGLLFLPQLAALPSLLEPAPVEEVAPVSWTLIGMAAANFFADQSFLGLLGLFGLGFVARRAYRARPGQDLLDGLALLTFAGLLGLALAYFLVGEIVLGESGYRLRAYMPAVVLAHFFVLHEVIHWGRQPRTRGLLLAAALLLSPFHALERPPGEESLLGLRPKGTAASNRQVYTTAAGRRLGRQLIASGPASAAEVGHSLHLLILDREILFFTEAARRELSGPAPTAPELGPDGYRVVELLSRDLEARIHAVEPCLHLPTEQEPLTGEREIRCPPSLGAPRHLYLVVEVERPGDELRVEVEGEAIPMLPAGGIHYTLWNDNRVLRSAAPLDLRPHEGKRLRVVQSSGKAPLLLFESPVILRDHLPPPEDS